MLLNKPTPARYIVKKVGRELLLVLLIASLVEVFLYFERDYVPPVPVALAAFLGTAISLLLSFKLNHSYDRWWEARKVWGAIVNDSRTLVRQLWSFVGRDHAIIGRMAHRQIAWCYALGHSLRGLDPMVDARPHLSAADITEVEHHDNVALALIELHARDLRELALAGHVTDYQRIAIDQTLTRLIDSQGKAERIRGTVFPPTYAMFVHAFIYVFITLLSVALAEIEGIWQVVITVCISVPLFLLEKTARHMQDPFSNRPTDTAVTAIARTIDLNTRQMLGEEERPGPAEDRGFYVL